MLISFSIENLLSFDARATFSMVSGDITKQHMNHVTKVGGLSVLRGAIIYGANAAGKSNLLKGLDLFRQMMSFNTCTRLAGHQFRGENSPKKDIGIELIFSSGDLVFTYIVRTDGAQVIEERLEQNTDNEDHVLFVRKGNDLEFGDGPLTDPWYKGRTFKESALYLVKLLDDGICVPANTSRFAGAPLIKAAIEGLSSLTVIGPGNAPLAPAFYSLSHQEPFLEFLRSLLRRADVGITDVRWLPVPAAELPFIKVSPSAPLDEARRMMTFTRQNSTFYVVETLGGQIKSAKELRTLHGKVPFRLLEESDGTLRLIELAPLLYLLENTDQTCFVDEIDCHLHPMLAKYLLETYMGKESSQIKSQLIVTAHDTNLLAQDIWRTDEVWFAEKRKDHSSDLYSLYQFKPRFDKNLEKGYLQGMYGALPFLGKAAFDE